MAWSSAWIVPIKRPNSVSSTPTPVSAGRKSSTPRPKRPKKFSASGHGAVLSGAAKRCGFGGQEAWAKGQRRAADPDGILFGRPRAFPEHPKRASAPELGLKANRKGGEGDWSSTGLVQPLIALTLRTRGYASPHSNRSSARAPVKAILVRYAGSYILS